MTIFQCSICHGGPFEQDEIIRIRTKEETFDLCGGWSCIKRLFAIRRPEHLPVTGAFCDAGHTNPAVATVTERSQRPLNLCAECLRAMFFERQGR